MIPLVMRCPIETCVEGEVSNWSHKDCGGRIYLTGNAYLYCEGCETKDHFLDWKFSCKIHWGKYQSPNINAVVLALSSAIASIQESISDKRIALHFMAGVQMGLYKRNIL